MYTYLARCTNRDPRSRGASLEQNCERLSRRAAEGIALGRVHSPAACPSFLHFAVEAVAAHAPGAQLASSALPLRRGQWNP